MSNDELRALVRPIPKRLIESAPQGKQGSYVPHFVIAQALLATVGPYDWQLVEVLRGPVPEHQQLSKDKKSVLKVWPALPNAIVGAVFRLTVQVDGRTVTVEEAGSCEAAAFEINDGERLKKAASDALKRCAMRLGVAIHLWCKRPDQFFVHRLLDEQDAAKHEAVVGVEGQDEEPAAEPTVAPEAPNLPQEAPKPSKSTRTADPYTAHKTAALSAIRAEYPDAPDDEHKRLALAHWPAAVEGAGENATPEAVADKVLALVRLEAPFT